MRRWVQTSILFPLVALFVSTVTSTVRADLGVANVALGLAVITTAAAVVNWPSGLATSVVAALSLNYFHTEPVHSLRIGSGADVLMVALLATIGISVSASTAVRARRRVLNIERSAESEFADQLVSMLAFPTSSALAWHSAIDASDHSLRLTEIVLVANIAANPPIPLIARPPRSSIDNDDHRSSFVLPEVGAVVEFRDPRLPYHLAITPVPGVGPLTIDRSTLFQLADSVETVLRRARNVSSSGGAD